MEKKGYVYLLADSEKDNIYKIGVTRGTIERRIKKLQTGNSGEIYICSYFQTEHPFFIEKHLHKKYCSKRVLNEWFELSPEETLNFKHDCESIEEMVKTMQENEFFPKKLN